MQNNLSDYVSSAPKFIFAHVIHLDRNIRDVMNTINCCDWYIEFFCFGQEAKADKLQVSSNIYLMQCHGQYMESVSANLYKIKVLGSKEKQLVKRCHRQSVQ